MELELDLYIESSRDLGMIEVTIDESELEEMMQRWINDRYTDTVLTSYSIKSIKL